jgi:hypothetical protein
LLEWYLRHDPRRKQRLDRHRRLLGRAVLATRDQGNTWTAYDIPLLSRATAGAFTIAFRDPLHGIVGGGDLDPNYPDNARTAVSHDGGKTWTITNRPPVTGAIFGLSYVRRNASQEQNLKRAVVITANTGGAPGYPMKEPPGTPYAT